MKELSLKKMENLQGGSDCIAESAAGVVSIFSLGAALSATGVGAGLGVGLALVGFGMAMYGVLACANNGYSRSAVNFHTGNITASDLRFNSGTTGYIGPRVNLIR